MPVKDSGAIFTQIQSRQLGAAAPMRLLNTARGSTDFIRKLGKWRILTGHDGCVNTIAWNESGDKILSGSDDCRLNIYDVGRNKLLESIRSGHRANIFSARFLPASADRKIVSCCGGGMIHYNEVGIDTYHGQNYFNCHSGTTYELTIIPGDPNSFLTCGEDGTVRHFDLRVKCNCYCQECKDDILIERPNANTSIMVNPLTPYHLAVGCEDSFVRIYDMRAISTGKERSRMAKSGRYESGIISILKPPQLKKSSCRITSLRYNETGSEILVSYCTDYVYLFSTNIQRVSSSSATLGNRNATQYGTNGFASDDPSKNLPPVKRLRLRGDWSDTGPNARPENEQDREENNTNSLMQRISDVFSRWLEDAFNEGVNQSANQSDGNEDPEDRESHSESEPPNSVERPPSPPQPGFPRDYIASEGAIENVPNMQEDDMFDGDNRIDEDEISPVEDLVEDLDLGGSDISDNVSRGNLGSRLKLDVADVDKGVSSDCEADRIQERPGEASNAPEIWGNPTLEADDTKIEQSSFDGGRLCTCGSDEDLFDEPCFAKAGSTLNCSKFNSTNGSRDLDTLSLDEEEYEEYSTPVAGPKEEKGRTICEVRNDALMNADGKSLPEAKSCSVGSLHPLENCDVLSDIDEMTNLEHTLDIERNFNNTLCGCDDRKNNALSGSISTLHVVDVELGCSDRTEVGDCNDSEGRENNKTRESNDDCIVCDDDIRILDETVHLGQTEHVLSGDSEAAASKTVKMDSTSDVYGSLGSLEPTPAIEVPDGAVNVSNSTNPVNLDGGIDEDSENRLSKTEGSRNSIPSTECSSVATPSSIDNPSRERGSEDGIHIENSLQNDHVTDRESEEGTVAAYENSASEGPSRTIAEVTSTDRVGPLRDFSVRRRHAAATRIQRCFRLQKKKTESQVDDEEEFLSNFEMPSPIMCYKGHRNARTMIKEANFWGDKFVISGSDCGRVFIWDKQTGELVVLLEGDKHVVNCVQPHPFDPILATSGIDYDIKVWGPTLQTPAVVTDLEEIISRNEQMLEESRDTITVPASFMLRMLASLSRVRGHRRSQQHDEDNSNEDSDD